MKTIEITSGDQKVQFTTKSVTFDGKEFLYANMTNVIHSTERHIYTFTYDGEVKLLPYDEKDEKILNTIFSQVQKLSAQKKAAAAGAAKEAKAADSAADAKPEDKDEAAKSEAKSESDKPEGDKAESAETASENAEAPQKADDPSKAPDKETSKDASVNVTDVLGKFKSRKSAQKKDEEKTDSKKNDDGKSQDKPEEDPEKKARRKKSLIIFGVIIAVLLICSIAYYYKFGTPSDPAPANPNSTESQQYDDIDQLIDDLQ